MDLLDYSIGLILDTREAFLYTGPTWVAYYWALKGKTVQVRRGPAAVTEDESHTKVTVRIGWEGVASREIRKPEDLPT